MIFSNFKSLLTTPRFVLPMLIQGVTFIMLFSYISASPFLVQKYMVFRHYTLVGCLQEWESHLLLRVRLRKISRLFSPTSATTCIYNYPNHWRCDCVININKSLAFCVISYRFYRFSGTCYRRRDIRIFNCNGRTYNRKRSASSLLGLLQSLLGGLVTPLVNLKGEYNSMPYIIIISLTNFTYHFTIIKY